MAVVVRHKDSGDRYILIGSGFGAFKASRPGVFFGNWNPVEESGEIPVVLVCNANGETTWIKSAMLEVVSVDGLPPGQVLGDGDQGDGDQGQGGQGEGASGDAAARS